MDGGRHLIWEALVVRSGASACVEDRRGSRSTAVHYLVHRRTKPFERSPSDAWEELPWKMN